MPGRDCGTARRAAHTASGRDAAAVPVVNDPAYATGGARSHPRQGTLARCFPGESRDAPTMQLAHLIAQECIAPAVRADRPPQWRRRHRRRAPDRLYRDTGRGGHALAGTRARVWRAGDREHPPPMPPGRTGSFALDRGIPFVYTEATGGGGAQAEVIECFRTGVERVMVALGMLPGPPPEPRHHDVWRGGGNTQWSLRAARGSSAPMNSLARSSRRGTLVGEIVDHLGGMRSNRRPRRDGMLAFVRRVPRVHPGDGLYLLRNGSQIGGTHQRNRRSPRHRPRAGAPSPPPTNAIGRCAPTTSSKSMSPSTRVRRDFNYVFVFGPHRLLLSLRWQIPFSQATATSPSRSSQHPRL